MVKLDIVTRSKAGFQPYGFAHHKGNGLGFGFADGLRGENAPLGPMQNFVRQFMYQRRKFLGLRLAGEQRDLSAVADTKGRGDLLVEFEPDVLLCEEIDQSIVVLAHFAVDAVLKFGQVGALGLRNILSRDLRPGFHALG